MKKRPAMITVIGWYLLVTNILGLLAVPLIFVAPEEVVAPILGDEGKAFLILSGVMVTLGVLCGVLIMKGSRFGRPLCVLIMLVNIVLNFVYDEFQSTFGSIINLAIIVIVLLPQYRNYFKREIQESNKEEETSDISIKDETKNNKVLPTIKKVGSVALFVFGIFILSLSVTMSHNMIKSFADPLQILAIVIFTLFIAVAFFIVPAIYLWGEKRKGLARLALFIAGGLHLIQGLSSYSKIHMLMALPSEKNEFVANFKAGVFIDIALGLVYICIGLVLAYMIDKAKKRKAETDDLEVE